MMQWKGLAVAGCLAATVHTTVQAQEKAAQDSAALWGARSSLSATLKAYATAQEVYYAGHNAYARLVSELAPAFKVAKGSSVTVLTNTKTGHSAIIVNEKVPGLVCAIMVGTAPTPFGGYFAEGQPLCQGP